LSIVLSLCISQAAPLQAQDAEPIPRRPGFVAFTRDLGVSTFRLFSRDNLAPLLAGGAAAGFTHSMDRPVRTYFDRGDRFGAFEERLEPLGGGAVVAGASAGLWIFSRFAGSEKFASFSHDLAQASSMNGLLTFGLKKGANRMRPDGSNRRSMPSGHASGAFAAATVVSRHYGVKAAIPAYAAAGFVAASRLDAGKHYLSDVIAGATLGYIVGRTVTRRTGARGRVQWVPLVSPGTQTVGIAFSWRLEADGVATPERRRRLP
jgi:hypothetical protein